MTILHPDMLRGIAPAILCTAMGMGCARTESAPQRVDSLGQILAAVPDSPMRQRWRDPAAKGQPAPLESLPIPRHVLATRAPATLRDTGNVAKTPSITPQAVAEVKVAALDAPAAYDGAFTVVSAAAGRLTGGIEGRPAPLTLVSRVPGNGSAVAALAAGSVLRLHLRSVVVENSQRTEVFLADAGRVPVLFKLSDGSRSPYARRFTDLPISLTQQQPGRNGVAPVVVTLGDARAALRPGERTTLSTGSTRVEFILLSSYWTAAKDIETAEGDPFHVMLVGYRVR